MSLPLEIFLYSQIYLFDDLSFLRMFCKDLSVQRLCMYLSYFHVAL